MLLLLLLLQGQPPSLSPAMAQNSYLHLALSFT